VQPAIVHAWGPVAANFAPCQGDSRLLVTLGSAEPDQSFARRWLSSRMHRRAARVVATSQTIAEKCSPRQPAVILPGVDASMQEPLPPTATERTELLDELQLPPTARLVLIVAQLVPRKAVKELIWITDLLRVMNDDVRFLVVGQGPQAAALSRYARLVCTTEHVRMLGPRNDVSRLLRHAAAYWHAGDEASPPLALLEAMAAQVPVVADNTAGCRQAITKNQNGLLVPPAQRALRARATERILQDASLAKRLGSAAGQTAFEQFSADRMATQYASQYQQLLA